jgi:hypothetical protein
VPPKKEDEPSLESKSQSPFNSKYVSKYKRGAGQVEKPMSEKKEELLPQPVRNVGEEWTYVCRRL